MSENKTIDDGGSAFPESYIGSDRPHEGIGEGMSLRAWLAGQALAGIASSFGSVESELMANRCVAFADAIIERLKR